MALSVPHLPDTLLAEIERLGARYQPEKIVPETWPTPAGDRALPPALRELARLRFPNSLLGRAPTFPQDAGRDLKVALAPLYTFELEDHTDPLISLAIANGDDYYRLSLDQVETVALEDLTVYKHLRSSRKGWDYQRLTECAHIDLLGFFRQLEPWRGQVVSG